jgi:hypothetical protein
VYAKIEGHFHNHFRKMVYDEQQDILKGTEWKFFIGEQLLTAWPK